MLLASSARPCRLDARSERQLSLCSSKAPPRRPHSTRLVNVIPHTAHAAPPLGLTNSLSLLPNRSGRNGLTVCAALQPCSLALLGNSAWKAGGAVSFGSSLALHMQPHARLAVNFLFFGLRPQRRVDPTRQCGAVSQPTQPVAPPPPLPRGHRLPISSSVHARHSHSYTTSPLARSHSSLPYIYQALLASLVSSIIRPLVWIRFEALFPPFTPLHSPSFPAFPPSLPTDLPSLHCILYSLSLSLSHWPDAPS